MTECLYKSRDQQPFLCPTYSPTQAPDCCSERTCKGITIWKSASSLDEHKPSRVYMLWSKLWQAPGVTAWPKSLCWWESFFHFLFQWQSQEKRDGGRSAAWEAEGSAMLMLALILINLITVATSPHFCTSVLRGANNTLLPSSVVAIKQFNKRHMFYV